MDTKFFYKASGKTVYIYIRYYIQICVTMFAITIPISFEFKHYKCNIVFSTTYIVILAIFSKVVKCLYLLILFNFFLFNFCIYYSCLFSTCWFICNFLSLLWLLKAKCMVICVTYFDFPNLSISLGVFLSIKPSKKDKD